MDALVLVVDVLLAERDPSSNCTRVCMCARSGTHERDSFEQIRRQSE